ncbi:MAG: UDP-N-acetylmuramate--L-alanine ligase [Ruminococcaceae bacterium]|nr:UDP-N-acetylmuramate--L-alanine ligase [Oscillospiraceae bacterium]
MNQSIHSYNRIHFIGIGGIMMSSLATMALDGGKQVTGSDRAPSQLTEKLVQKGAVIYYGQCAENIALSKAELVVYTAAIHPDNPELKAAKQAGLPMLSRAEYLGELMLTYRHRVGISGTHGKSTTTGMLTSICLAAKTDPTVLCGARLSALEGEAFRSGNTGQLVYESCEYTDSFLSFHPTVAVVLNVDLDHVDYFHSMEQLQASFRRSAQEADTVIANWDDAGARETFRDFASPVIWVSVKENSARYLAKDLYFEKGCGAFLLMDRDQELGRVTLSVPGMHNVQNALCAAAAALSLGISMDAIAKGLASFGGAVRRFEKKGSREGVDVFDDYAHHPTEIYATLQTAKTLGYDRIVTVFQSHTYSRTAQLLTEFAKALSLSDLTLIAPIFAAREENVWGVSSADIAVRMNCAVAFDSMDETLAALRKNVRPGDLVITMGAGNIYKVGSAFLKGEDKV